MTRTEHLLFILSEECNEVGQRASKAARFGLAEVQPGQSLTNAERIVAEYTDLLAVVEMLAENGDLAVGDLRQAMDAKKSKVEMYLRYSAKCGTLTENVA